MDSRFPPHIDFSSGIYAGSPTENIGLGDLVVIPNATAQFQDMSDFLQEFGDIPEPLDYRTMATPMSAGEWQIRNGMTMVDPTAASTLEQALLGDPMLSAGTDIESEELANYFQHTTQSADSLASVQLDQQIELDPSDMFFGMAPLFGIYDDALSGEKDLLPSLPQTQPIPSDDSSQMIDITQSLPTQPRRSERAGAAKTTAILTATAAESYKASGGIANPRVANKATTKYPVEFAKEAAVRIIQSQPPLMQKRLGVVYSQLHRPAMTEVLTRDMIECAIHMSDNGRVLNPQELTILKRFVIKKGDLSGLLAPPGEIEINRNHRLADSSIHALLLSAFTTATTQSGQLYPLQEARLNQFICSVAGTSQAANIKTAFGMAVQAFLNHQDQDAGHYLQNASALLSISPKNIRFGDGTENQRISSSYDGVQNELGRYTPISETIAVAVQELGTPDVLIPTMVDSSLAQAAITPATDMADQVLTSSITQGLAPAANFLDNWVPTGNVTLMDAKRVLQQYGIA